MANILQNTEYPMFDFSNISRYFNREKNEEECCVRETYSLQQYSGKQNLLEVEVLEEEAHVILRTLFRLVYIEK